MTLHTPELLRQNEAHKAIQARLLNPPVRVYRDTAEGLKISLREANEALERMTKDRDRIKAAYSLEERYSKKLELDVADRDARILTLGQRVSELEGLGLTSSSGKRAVADIVSEVLKDFPGIEWDDIKGIRRHRSLIIPRQRCMYEVARQRPDISLPRIGKIFGGKDHSTICHAVKKVRLQLEGEDHSQDWHDRQVMAAKRGSAKPIGEKDPANGV